MGRDPRVTSKIMATVRASNTKPEISVRSRLWALGYRYRVDYRKVAGRPDIAFPALRVAIFIDGDFWHGNAWKVRGYRSLEDLFPTRTEWWVGKIRKNIERDKQVNELLSAQGWMVLRFWESVVEKQLDEVISTIVEVLEERRRSDSGGLT